MTLLKKTLLVLGLWVGAAVTLVVARYIAESFGVALGAFPVTVIALLFLYLIVKVIRTPREHQASSLTDAELLAKLDAMAANPKLSDEKRAEARSHAEGIRARTA